MMARLLIACLAFVLLAGGARAEERRVALVIGVTAYQHVPPIPNPRNDATAIAASLKRLGFDVDLVVDPDRPTMEAAVRRLGNRAKGADAAMLYYAGHAVEVAGQNWLIPTTADPRTDKDMPFEAVPLDLVVDQLNGAAHVSLIFLDSCRDNPFTMQLTVSSRGFKTGGLSAVQPVAGTFVAFSTAPGTVAMDGTGEHSPFTQAMLTHIEEPGIDIHQLLDEVRGDVLQATQGAQTPWENSSLLGRFLFNPVSVPAATAAAPPAAAATDLSGSSPPPSAPPRQSNEESLFWQTILRSKDPADFNAYLARFPDGVYAPLARNRLNQLAMATQPPPVPRSVTPPPAPTPPAAVSPPPAATLPAVGALDEPAASPAALHDALVARIAAGLPRLAPEMRENRVATYLAMNKAHKALAMTSRGVWMFEDWRTAAVAEERTLEGCQVYAGEPCRLIAVDDRLAKLVDGKPPVRDMPRVAYAGTFDPDLVPAVRAPQLLHPGVVGYATASGPKAMALHPDGRIFIATGAPDQHAAEAKALAECIEDPVRKGHDGPCYLYASGNQVVLPMRRTDPIAVAASAQKPSAHPSAPAADLTPPEASHPRGIRPRPLHLER